MELSECGHFFPPYKFPNIASYTQDTLIIFLI
jgi:hypothetical protein